MVLDHQVQFGIDDGQRSLHLMGCVIGKVLQHLIVFQDLLGHLLNGALQILELLDTGTADRERRPAGEIELPDRSQGIIERLPDTTEQQAIGQEKGTQ